MLLYATNYNQKSKLTEHKLKWWREKKRYLETLLPQKMTAGIQSGFLWNSNKTRSKNYYLDQWTRTTLYKTVLLFLNQLRFNV